MLHSREHMSYNIDIIKVQKKPCITFQNDRLFSDAIKNVNQDINKELNWNLQGTES